MKSSKILSGAVAMVTLQQASAALLIHENFNYSAGSIAGVATTGTGVSGNWAVSGAAAAPLITVQASSLAFAGHFSSSGGSLQMTNNGNSGWDESRVAATVGVTLPVSSTFYASSLMTMNTAGQYYNDWVVEQRFNSTVGGDFSTSSGRNVVSAYGSGGGATRNAGVSSDSDEVSVVGVATTGTNYLLVTVYTSSATDVTQATLYGFNSTTYASYLANSTPANAAANLATYASFTANDSENSALSGYQFLQFNIQGGPVGVMDDFRLGTAITDVVNVIPEPSAAFLLILGSTAITLRRRRNTGNRLPSASEVR